MDAPVVDGWTVPLADPAEAVMSDDPEILTGVSEEELEALADSLLSLSAQARLDDLLRRNSADQLPPDEQIELDRLLAKVDQLTILKTRARYTLEQRAGTIRA